MKIFAILILLWSHFQSIVCRYMFPIIHMFKPPPLPPITNSLLKQSASTLAKKVRNQELSSQTLVQACIDRIEEVNPFLNAIVEDRFEEALAEAKKCDAMLKSGEVNAVTLEKEKPLFGVPVTIKESLSLNGMSCAGGNLANEGRKAPKNSSIVDMVLNAGAIPLCVTNTSELCCSIHSSNVLTGVTKNPYDTRLSPGGSSGGEGALLASGGSVLGFGSDLLGSIRVPSLFNGVFGHKPSPGIISNEGHFPYSTDPTFMKMLVVGPMAKHATDLRFAMKILTPNLSQTLRLDEPINLKTIRVFYLEQFDSICGINDTTQDIKDKIKDAVRHLKGIGVHVEELPQDYVKNMYLQFMATFGDIKFPTVVETPKGDMAAPSVVEYHKGWFGLSKYSAQLSLTRMVVEANGFMSSQDVQEVLAEREILRKKLDTLLDERTAIIMPTYAQPTTYPAEIVLQTDCAVYCAFCNFMYCPATHVPMGLNEDDLPVGFQVVAACNQDRICLTIAEELERAFGGWVPPPS
nr:fatty-acid amide hydrolase 2-A-like [Megalopta genalis]